MWVQTAGRVPYICIYIYIIIYIDIHIAYIYIVNYIYIESPMYLLYTYMALYVPSHGAKLQDTHPKRIRVIDLNVGYLDFCTNLLPFLPSSWIFWVYPPPRMPVANEGLGWDSVLIM